MIVVVSGIGILVSIYNSMSERQHEIAVVRALGAGRQTVMLLVLLESILLSLIGGLAGWAGRPRTDRSIEPLDRHANRRFDWLLAVCGLRVGYNTSTRRFGRRRRLFAGRGRLSHGRGQGVQRQPPRADTPGRPPDAAAEPAESLRCKEPAHEPSTTSRCRPGPAPVAIGRWVSCYRPSGWWPVRFAAPCR